MNEPAMVAKILKKSENVSTLYIPAKSEADAEANWKSRLAALETEREALKAQLEATGKHDSALQGQLKAANDKIAGMSKEFDELQHAYACTIHKSQGSEYPMVVLVLHDSQKWLLKRKILYTGLTRAKKACVIIGTRSALATAGGLDGEGMPAVTAPPVVGPRPTAYI